MRETFDPSWISDPVLVVSGTGHLGCGRGSPVFSDDVLTLKGLAKYSRIERVVLTIFLRKFWHA